LEAPTEFGSTERAVPTNGHHMSVNHTCFCTHNWVLSVGQSKNCPMRIVELYVSCYLKQNQTLGVYGYAVEYQYL